MVFFLTVSAFRVSGSGVTVAVFTCWFTKGTAAPALINVFAISFGRSATSPPLKLSEVTGPQAVVLNLIFTAFFES